jgi:hypothetical protein
MATDQPTESAVPNINWVRSSEFRTFFSNFFQYRVGSGDVSFVFSTISTDDSAQGLKVLRQEAEVFMTWPQLKNLVLTMSNVVNMIEAEVGPIPAPPPNAAELEKGLESMRGHVRAVNLKVLP